MKPNTVIRICVLFVFLLNLAGIQAQGPLKSVKAAFDCLAQTDIPQSECEALTALYISTNGPGWTRYPNTWLTALPCDWYGIGCSYGHVISIILGDNNLIGNLPPQLGNLPELQNLHLFHNQLTGSIPAELGQLSKLEYLNLAENQLFGNIPPVLGKLTQLAVLDLHTNQLTGEIPVQLGNLTLLWDLDLSNNQLSGTIPVELGHLSKMMYLRLSQNQLHGSIPAEFAELSQLQDLSISFNQLTGTIPVELASLNELRVLGLSYNQLSGTLPVGFGNLPFIGSLYLNDNPQLSGLLPLSLMDNRWVRTVYFSNTQICEPGDKDFQTWLGNVWWLSRTHVICQASFLPSISLRGE